MTCEQVLTDYIINNPGWHKKVNLYSVAEDWNAETVGRALRKLSEEEKIKVDYYDGKYAKGLAMYCSNDSYEPPQRVPKIQIIEINGIRTAVYV